jgi:hypothetical protein
MCVELDRALVAFRKKQPSRILNHNSTCCEVAQGWFRGMDRSSRLQGPVTGMPLWIREHFDWGPSQWPLHWCELMASRKLDCGALAALTHVSLRDRGVPSFPAQTILNEGAQRCAHWLRRWTLENCPCDWIASPLVYHEVCAVPEQSVRDLRLWNPSANAMMEWTDVDSISAVAAVRVVNAESDQVSLGGLTLPTNIWVPARVVRRPSDGDPVG